MSIIDTLIYDRTAADIARWLDLRNKGYAKMTDSERAEWDAGMKGAYNATDLNRVGSALNYIRDRLADARYMQKTLFTAKTDWVAGDIPTPKELEDYLGFVSAIREALAQFATTPATPTYTGGLDYQEANAIEKILVDVDQLITNAIASRYYCGELFCGEV